MKTRIITEEQNPQVLSFKVGYNNNSLDELKYLCEEKLNSLISSTEFKLEDGQTIEVRFWTKNMFAELIGVATILKNVDNQYTYAIDFGQSTL